MNQTHFVVVVFKSSDFGLILNFNKLKIKSRGSSEIIRRNYFYCFFSQSFNGLAKIILYNFCRDSYSIKMSILK